LGEIEAVGCTGTGAVTPDSQRLTSATDEVEAVSATAAELTVSYSVRGATRIAIRASALRKETAIHLDRRPDKHCERPTNLRGASKAASSNQIYQRNNKAVPITLPSIPMQCHQPGKTNGQIISWVNHGHKTIRKSGEIRLGNK
jgi:hypothetical protein